MITCLERINFQRTLEKDNSLINHRKNLQELITEMFKVQNDCSPEIMNKVFPINEPILEYTFLYINNQKFKQSPRKSLIC